MSLTLAEYQRHALSTAIYPVDAQVYYPALGLNGEAGEIADIVKKGIRDGALTESQKHRLKKEIGDVLWYAAALAFDMGWSLEEIAEENLVKLADRKNRGVLQGSGDNR